MLMFAQIVALVPMFVLQKQSVLLIEYLIK